MAIGLVGQTTIYRDRIHVVIAGRKHDWLCDFVKLPAASEARQQPRELPPVLGRAGFLTAHRAYRQQRAPVPRHVRRTLLPLPTFLFALPGPLGPMGRNEDPVPCQCVIAAMRLLISVHIPGSEFHP